MTTTSDLRQDGLPVELGRPEALRGLSPRQLEELAAGIRRFLVDNVCRTGGHLGSNLGAVELTLALHLVFESPRDVIMFDTGHQSYVHKIVTGRQAGFGTLRRRGGLSGYPSRTESPHDVIENSHASTAVGYADGIARAHEILGETSRWVVAVIGDGALTGGMAYEALNNIASAEHRRLVIVLNDNGRSYDPTVGGLGEHLHALRQGAAGSRNVFESLGLGYLGPVDGHDVTAVRAALLMARAAGRPVVVHCVTVKGRGYPPAEADQTDHLHGIGVVDTATGRPAGPSEPSWTSVFGAEIADLGARHQDVVCLTAAMLRPVGLAEFAARFPERVVDVGIAEQHAVCSAAGLASAGLHPVVCVYATFLNRAFDQLLMDVALHRFGVTFVLDRAGITGPDGPSHHGMWDTGLLSGVPGLRLAAPRDPARLRELLGEAVVVDDAPTVVRFPKATAGPDIEAVDRVDGLDVLHDDPALPRDVLLVAIGAMAAPCLAAAAELRRRGVGATVVDPRWVAPVNPGLVDLAARYRLVLTVEDAVRVGGAGAMLTQACGEAAVPTPVHNLGLPREFVDHGDRAELLAEHGLTGESIAWSALGALERSRPAERVL